MAAGRVCTGFSKPYVAPYSETGTTHYTGGMIMARGVDVSASYTTGDESTFAADNVSAESAGGTFASGNLSETVDGLFQNVRRILWSGIGEADSNGFSGYSGNIKGQNVGHGVVARYMSDGVESFVPYVYPNIVFNLPDLSAATSENDSITWTTETLTAKILKDHAGMYLYEGGEETTEAAAEAKIKAFLHIA